MKAQENFAMIKKLLLGGTMLLAIPALAQTSGTTGGAGTQQGGTATTTNDHDPTQTPADAGTPSTDAPVLGTQVNGGVTSSSPGMGTATAGQSGQVDHSAHARQMGQGNQTGQAGQMGQGSQMEQGGLTDRGGSMTQSGQSGTTQQGVSDATGFQGAGGPAMREYPPCSRTVTDSCIQRERRR